jgi:acyl-CoA thioesterase YciA
MALMRPSEYANTVNAEPYLAIRVVMMPKDANPLPAVLDRMLPEKNFYLPHLSICGGGILSHIDSAGAIGARHEVAKAGGELPFLVTVAINRVEFKKPVLVGDVVSFKTRLVSIGRTSITMNVSVESERGTETLQVTEAEVVYVGINPHDRKPQPLLAEDNSPLSPPGERGRG